MKTHTKLPHLGSSGKSSCVQGEPIGVFRDRVRGEMPRRGELQERVPQRHRKEIEAWNKKGREEQVVFGVSARAGL